HIYFCKPLFSYFFSMENAAIRGGRYRWILNFVRENIASERDFIPIDDFYVSVRRFQTGFAGFGMLAYGHENFIVGVVKRNRHDLTVRGEGFHFHCLCLLFCIVFRLHHHTTTYIYICKPPFRIFFSHQNKKSPRLSAGLRQTISNSSLTQGSSSIIAQRIHSARCATSHWAPRPACLFE